MRCSGGSDCDCTSFQPRKSSSKCKACSHLQGDYSESSGNESSGDSNNDSNNDSSNDNGDNNSGHDVKNEAMVSALLMNLLEDGHYTSGQVESAKNEAKAGLTRKHVGHFLKLRLATRAHHTAT